MKKPQIVAYLRVSGNKQDTDSQKVSILEYAQKEGLKVDRYAEITISATRNAKAQRKHVAEQMAKINEGSQKLGRLKAKQQSEVDQELQQLIDADAKASKQ